MNADIYTQIAITVNALAPPGRCPFILAHLSWRYIKTSAQALPFENILATS